MSRMAMNGVRFTYLLQLTEKRKTGVRVDFP